MPASNLSFLVVYSAWAVDRWLVFLFRLPFSSPLLSQPSLPLEQYTRYFTFSEYIFWAFLNPLQFHVARSFPCCYLGLSWIFFSSFGKPLQTCRFVLEVLFIMIDNFIITYPLTPFWTFLVPWVLAADPDQDPTRDPGLVPNLDLDPKPVSCKLMQTRSSLFNNLIVIRLVHRLLGLPRPPLHPGPRAFSQSLA